MKLRDEPRIQWSSWAAVVAVVTVGCTGAPPSRLDGGAGNGGSDNGGGDVTASNAGTTGSGRASGSGGAPEGIAGVMGLAGAEPATPETSANATGGSASADRGDSGPAGMAGDAGASNGCVKSLGLWFIVRNDGHVLFEQRDETKEATILGPDAKALTNTVDLTGGNGYGCALLGDGTVWCWQEVAGLGNRYGQIGGGTSDSDATAPIERASQVLVAAGQPLTGVKALAKGTTTGAQTCAVTTDGKLYCWGDLTWLANAGTAVVSPYAQAVTADGFTHSPGSLRRASARRWHAPSSRARQTT